MITDSKEVTKPLPSIWLKAAMLGSLWASSEIILGSFLHNLNVPMTGTLLAAVGVALMVGAHQLWPERGLFWRAALICAAMKSVSPSAVILGPMIGILTEGALLEAATRLLGRNAAGYAVGGSLAVSSAFFQKLVGLLIGFGWNLVELYERLFEFAAKSLHITRFGPLDLIVAFVGLNLLAGVVVALAAVRIGRRARDVPPAVVAGHEAVAGRTLFDVDPRQHFSLSLLFVHIAIIIFGLSALNNLPVGVSAPLVIVYSGLCAWRYKKSLARLKRLKMWLGLAVVMMLSGLFLDSLSGAGEWWSWSGLLIGLTMTLRAMLMVIGFASFSVELRNPAVLRWFSQRHLETFSAALRGAFEALPEFTALLSEQKQLLTRPSKLMPQVLRHADDLVQRHEASRGERQPVVFLVGEKGEGKTTAAEKLVEALRRERLNVGGILAPGLWKDGEREGFDVVNIATGARTPLCRRGVFAEVKIGPFGFFGRGLQLGNAALSVDALRKVDVIVVDEVGPLELRGDGWSQALDVITTQLNKPLVWVVRRSLIDEVAKRWRILPSLIIPAPASPVLRIAEFLKSSVVVSRVKSAVPRIE